MRLLLAALAATAFIPACTTEEPERKPVPPPSTSSQIPWNRPVPNQGGGAMGVLNQTPRR